MHNIDLQFVTHTTTKLADGDTRHDFTLGYAGEIFTQPSKAQRTRQRLLQVLKDRLATPGPIRTGDAWEIYRRHRFGYATGAIIFKSIMEDMITAGTARKTGKGQYWIGPGEPEAPPEKQEDPPAFVHKPYYRSSDEPAPKAPSHGSRVKPFFSKVYGTMISPD